MEIDESSIIQIVVFSNRSKLSKINISEKQNVYQYRNALRFIRNHEKKSELKVDKKHKVEYLIRLLDKCNMSEEIKQKHISDVKELQGQNA